MSFQRFSLYNNITGWLVFAAAAIVYLSTKQPTTSLWDCGEYISAALKMQTVHPPGRPMFLMLNHFFTLFAPDPTWVAPIMNGVSSVSGAFSALFACWSAVMLGLRFYPEDPENIAPYKAYTLLGAGVIAGLSFTFSTTSWFTAVEAEVYAMSATFIALLIWLILKWDRRAHHKDHLRWVVLIAFVLGVSIGVHLLGLLIIPGLALMFYFRYYEFSWTGVTIALVAGVVAVGIILNGIITGLPMIGAYWFDLPFVNNYNLPIWSGVIFMSLIIGGLVIYGIYYTRKKDSLLPLHVGLICMLMIMIGYSTYTTVVLRSMADPPINMNDPDDAFSYYSYINREQYGESPLFFGQYFTADVLRTEEGRDQYVELNSRYENVGARPIPVYDPEHETVFPRMWSNRGDHAREYRQWANLSRGERPSFADNIGFMFQYQLGHMYFRYFAWNFIGRQNDIQGHGEFHQGNWITGIPVFDEHFRNVGPQSNLPQRYRENKGRHFYFGLPFLLGLLGIYIILKRRWTYGVATLFFFFMTGAGIIIALNPTPMEPRERDYAFLGSFYVFCIFIGLGLIQLVEFLKNYIPNKVAAGTAFAASLLAVPAWMAYQNWEGHDRSNDYTPRDYAVNYLESCDSNAILFTSGDNDTYPLWYAQEVEGIRNDVRIVNLSLLNTGWYNSQIRKDHGPSKGVDLHTPVENAVRGRRERIMYQPRGREDAYYDLGRIVRFIASDEDHTKARARGGQQFNIFPTQNFIIPVDRQKVIENGTVPEDMTDRVVDEIRFELDRNQLMKADFLTLDIIATNNWERPIYFAMTTGSDAYLNLTDYFQMDGLTYRLVPIENRRQETDRAQARVHTGIMYDNVMNKFQWGNLDSGEDVYLHSVAMRQANNMRRVFHRLGAALVREGQNEKAVEVIDKAMEVLPQHNVPFDFFVVPLMEIYYQADTPDKGETLAFELADIFKEELDYYVALPGRFFNQVEIEAQRAYVGLETINRHARQNDQEELEQLSSRYMEQFDQLRQEIQRRHQPQQRQPQPQPQQPQQPQPQ